MRRALAPALLGATLLLAGCGGSGASSSTTQSSGAQSAAAVKPAKQALAVRRKAEASAPKGASPTLKAIYATFPPPRPEPKVRRSAQAIKAGERACAGKTPTEVKEAFYPAAAANLSAEQRQMIARIASFEATDPKSASFTAGQLAADVYEASLPQASGQYGYEGCVYSLARGLERRLAPRG